MCARRRPPRKPNRRLSLAGQSERRRGGRAALASPVKVRQLWASWWSSQTRYCWRPKARIGNCSSRARTTGIRPSFGPAGVKSPSVPKCGGACEAVLFRIVGDVTTGAKMESPAKVPNITASELGRLLDRIISSPGFRRSMRLQRFLRYVTEHAVEHPGRPIKEIQVAMAVFDKEASFDPRLDPIVRVEAGRLRLRLLEYYAEAGDRETIVIEIPQGRYVPNFRVLDKTRRRNGSGDAEDPASRRLYLKGRYFWGKRTAADLAKAAEYFRRALAVNSGYARAYLGLADCYAILGTFGFVPPGGAYPKAKAAALAALKIDPRLTDAHATLATLSALYEWDRAGAEVGFRQAIDIEPGYAFAHQMYGVALLGWRRPEEGLAALKTAEQLEPLARTSRGGLPDGAGAGAEFLAGALLPGPDMRAGMSLRRSGPGVGESHRVLRWKPSNNRIAGARLRQRWRAGRGVPAFTGSRKQAIAGRLCASLCNGLGEGELI